MAMSYEERQKVRKVRTGFGIAAAILTFVIAASQGSKEPAKPAAVSAMTATTQGQVTGVSGDVGHRMYEVAFTDGKSDRHTATAYKNQTDEYSRGDFVEVVYDPSNPDGGCQIKRILVDAGALVDQAEGNGGSSGGSSSGGSTIAQQLLDKGNDDGEGRDVLSELSRRKK